MGRDLFEQSHAAREIFERADDVLGYALSQRCFDGPEEILQETQNSQPAIFTVSYACLAAARKAGSISADPPAFCAGHSLGEYTAIVAADALSFDDGLRLVQERGRLMQQAGEARPGTMAAILGLARDVVADICEESGTELCNLNAPGQIVIGGSHEAIDKAMALATERGARRSVQLKVGGAFHTSLMESAVEGMKAAIENSDFHDASVPVVANTTGEPVTAADTLRQELVNQVARPVQWERSVEFMISRGVNAVVEFGPGRVLTGLVRRIDKTIELRNISGTADIAHA